jgi:cyanophycinase
MNRNKMIPALLVFLILVAGCNAQQGKDAEGKLFIIGGGKRPPEMIKRLVEESGVDRSGYIAILPMSSAEPDTAFFYAKKQFVEQGIKDVFNFNFELNESLRQSKTDSLKNARLIYISGGDQSKFMQVVSGNEIHDAIHEAFQNGSTIAGTSAGAAVMSKKMITGNEFKHPEYTGEFRTIEADNMELKEGLGLLPNAIIDQHFIWRMRMNRLITVAIENPEETCIGIDESTAILVKGNQAEVVGKYQVIVIKNNGGRTVQDGLLGAENMRLGVYLPGQTFAIE